MTKTLVLGSEGFIGRHLMTLLEDASGYDLKDGQDIRIKEQLESYMEGVDVVVHLAAQTAVSRCWDDPVDFYSHNILGTANVIETAIKCKVKKIIYASSASVYSPLENPYSLSKTVCEDLFRLRAKEIDTIAFRFMNVYGKGQNPAYGTVIPAFYQGIQKGEITIFGDGSYTRDYVHVKDVATVLWLATQKKYYNKFKGFNVMDLGTGKSTSVKEVAEKLMKTLDKKAKIKYVKPRPEIKHMTANITKLKKLFEYRPVIDFDKGLYMLKGEGI